MAASRCAQWFMVVGFSATIASMGRTSTAAEGRSNFPITTSLLETGDSDVKIVCFGDSVTGVYYHTGGRRAYADMLGVALRRIYPRARPVMINAGISGNNTRAALARIDKDVLQIRPQLVTVMFGLNDLVGVPIEEYSQNVTKIVDQCRAVGAEVLLCTPNGVEETTGRPIAKLEEYRSALKRVAAERNVPLADCYGAYQEIKSRDVRQFELLFSDEIHPNMDGHKLNAEILAQAITARRVSLADVAPLEPALPKLRQLVKAGKPATILAMPPFDELIGPAMMQVAPNLEVKVISWPTKGQTLAEIEQAAKKVREMHVDCVLIAIPAQAGAETIKTYQHSYTWIMNWSLSFGVQEWDCVAVAASVIQPNLSDTENSRDALALKLIKAQDLGTIERDAGDTSGFPILLRNWLRQELR